MRRTPVWYWLHAVLVLFSSALCAAEHGRIRIAQFQFNAAGASDYNYGIAQDDAGRIWVANERPLLFHDGQRWTAVSHAGDRTGSHQPLPVGRRVYGSTAADIGYYEADATGRYRWHSLRDELAPELRQIGRVTGPVRAGEAIWFHTSAFLLRFGHDGTQLALPAQTLEPLLIAAADGVYVVNPALGPQQVQRVGDRLIAQALPLADESLRKRINSLLVLPDSLLLLTRQRELLRHAGDGGTQAFAQQLWPEFAQRRLNSLLALRDGQIALGFLRGGVWVLDAQGELVERYDETSAAAVGSVSDLFEDREGGLWVSQIGGVLRIDRGSGFSQFGIESGIPQALALVRHAGRIYAVGRGGVYRQSSSGTGVTTRFERLDEALPGAADAWSRGDRLWLAGAAVQRIRFDAAGRVLESDRIEGIDQARRFGRSRRHADRVYVINIDASIDVLDQADSAKPSRRRIEGIEGIASKLVVEPDETLWTTTVDGALWRIRPDAADTRPQRFDHRHGLPVDGAIDIEEIDLGLVVTSDQGVLRFDAPSERFVPMAGLDGPLQHAPVTKLAADADGNLYARGPSAIGIWRRQGAQYRWDATTLAQLSPLNDVHGVLIEDETLWLARSTGVERLRLPRQARSAPLTNVLLSGMRASRPGIALNLPGDMELQLGSDVRDLEFTFGLPLYSGPRSSQFRTRLLGYDQQWSDYSEQGSRSFTNVPDGAFQLDVQARSPLGADTATRSYRFAVAAPWWRTPWAYGGYLLLGLLALWSAAGIGARWRQRGLLQRQRQLQATVAARTAELSVSNQQLAEQAQRLTEMDQLKTRFFINVGHEFRTPLTLVLGPLDDVLSDARQLEPGVRDALELAHRNARRVLDLIVELLDVNRLEHGQLRLAPVATDLVCLLGKLGMEQQSLVQRHGQQLELKLHCATAPAWVDPLQLERALNNLLSNGAKYMARGGSLTLVLLALEDGWLIEVRDTGRGIAASALPHVFDRFFQAEGCDQASGYGIGLALVHEIVEAHGGRVSVDSTLGAGSCFRIELPCTAEQSASARAALAQQAAPVNAVQPVLARTGAGCLRVLVVDDHAEMRARICALLRERFEVFEAHDGPSAWNAALEHLPDLIVSDVMMPGFDGIELARRLRADPETCAVGLLLLTARAGSELAVQGLRAGANDYLVKPFDASELLARIDAIHAHAQRLRLRLAREAQPAVPAPSEETGMKGGTESAEQRWRLRLDELIRSRLDDPELSVERLAEALHLDRSSLFRRCKELLGSSPSDYVRETRLQRGYQLLEQSAGNVSEVAYAVGFESLSSFTRAFKARFGSAPSQISRRGLSVSA